MNLGKKFLKKVKIGFGKKPSRTEHPSDHNIFVGTLASRPGIAGEGNEKSIQMVKAGSTGTRGDNNAAPATPSHLGGERAIGNMNTAMDNRSGAQDVERQNMDRRYPNDQRDIDSVEKIHDIPGIDPSTSNNQKHHGAVSHTEDGKLLVPSGQHPTPHFPSESTKFNDTKHSGISVGGGAVNVSNVNSGNTTTVHGILVQNNTTGEQIRSGLKVLQKRVATSAFHDSVHRVDPPRCHPDTRVAIQNQIYDWIVLDLMIRQMWIMWIHGAAGGGKSAIMQSIAERCEKAHIPLASFFFFRTDPIRNSIASFIATIVYQLIQKIPQVQDEICLIIGNNPLIFDESLESQLQKLVIQPLLRLRELFKDFFVIMIDGLDECIERVHQVDLIKLLGTISRSRLIPVIFLVASRREPQIEAVFIRKQILDLVLTLPLDNSDIEQTSEDIRHFLTDRFHDITETHLRRHLLPTNWPQESAVEEIVTKSSGQFIYASVVINYVSSPRGNPAHLLDIVRGIRLREPSSQNPFAHLDALYQYIFSQVEALDKVLDILAHILITKYVFIQYIEYAFLLEYGGLEVCLADLTAVIKCSGPRHNKIEFLHASLPDFLRDQTRSERYHIDFEKYIPKLLYMFLDRRLDPALQADNLEDVIWKEHYRLYAIMNLLATGVKASDRLHQSFMTFNIVFCKKSFKDYLVGHVIGILKYLKQLNFNDEGQAYHHVLDQFATEFAKYWAVLSIHDKRNVRDTPDLRAHIGQIRHEELDFDSPPEFDIFYNL